MTTSDPDSPRPRHVAGDGELPPWWSALPRRRLALALGSTLVAVPVVVLDNLPRHTGAEASAESASAASSTSSTSTSTTLAPPSSTTITVEAPRTTSSSTTSTTAAPTTTTTAAPPTTTTSTTAPPPITTTTAPPAPPQLAAAPANSQSGVASWYRYRAGECAHRTLPRGTVVTVTNTATGASTTCVVTDRGPYGRGRIIDLDDDTFAQIAPLAAGVVQVTITW